MTKARRLLVAIGLVAAGAAYLVLVGLQPAYRNPVLDNDTPDPSVVRTADGTYYAYTTQAYFGAQFVNVPILHSSDLLSWELAGDAFPDNPEWAVRSPGDMWAPHMAEWDDGSFRLTSPRREVTRARWRSAWRLPPARSGRSPMLAAPSSQARPSAPSTPSSSAPGQALPLLGIGRRSDYGAGTQCRWSARPW